MLQFHSNLHSSHLVYRAPRKATLCYSIRECPFAKDSNGKWREDDSAARFSPEQGVLPGIFSNYITGRKTRSKKPSWVGRFQEESSPKFPKSKDAGKVSENSVWAWSRWRKAHTNLTWIGEIRFGPLLCLQWFFRLNHCARQWEIYCWEEEMLHKVKQDHGGSQNDKPKKSWASRHWLWKQQNWILFTRYSLTYFFVNIPFWRTGITNGSTSQRSTELIERDQY